MGTDPVPGKEFLVGRRVDSSEVTLTTDWAPSAFGPVRFTMDLPPSDALELAAKLYVMAEELLLEDDGVLQTEVKAEFDEARREFEG